MSASVEESNDCVKIEPKEHIVASLENRDLSRDTKQLDVNEELLEQLASNYIIVKNILRHLPWQDQFICKLVCKTWHSAVTTLQREMLHLKDFVMAPSRKDNVTYNLILSGKITTEPLAVMTFTNASGYCYVDYCKNIKPHSCSPPCGNKHRVLDFIDHEIVHPKDCMLVVQASDLAYMPLSDSITYPYTLKSANLDRAVPQICGTYIPKIPNVNYHVIHLKASSPFSGNEIKKNYHDVIDKIASTEIFKGVIVYVTDRFVTLDYVEDIGFLNYFKTVQPNIPFAFGGCIIEDVVSNRSEMLQYKSTPGNPPSPPSYFSDNVLSVVVFTVPKDESGAPLNKSNFEMYSCVMETTEYSKEKIEKFIKEFSESVPRFENSLVFKLSCVGRDQRHKFEQETFRSFFPKTPLIGCYGNGELGHNHPERPQPEPSPFDKKNSVKRARKNAPFCGILYSYSTVFVYFGWGKNI